MNDKYNPSQNTPSDSPDTPQHEPYHWNTPNAESGAYHTAGASRETVFGENQSTEQTPPQNSAQFNAASTAQNDDFGKPLYERKNKAFFGSGFSSGSGNAPKPNNNATKKLVSVAVVCALAGGLVGGTLGSAAGNSFLRPSTTVQVSDRTVNEVKQMTVDGKTAMTNAENYAANVNSVVSINVGTQKNYFGQIVEQASCGSGFILTNDGYILTNHHVVANATTIEVTTYSGDTYQASYIGGDEDYDIAVIKVDVKGLRPVVIGDSDLVNVGDDVIAVGNPLGELTFSLTSGSVSSANRAITVQNTPFNMIQIDCSINPGNSGGPLFNQYGEVVGIVSAKYSTYADTTVEGLGFAIPINDVYAMVEDIMENGYVVNKAYLGITGGSITEQLQMQLNLPVAKGVYVFSIDPKGPAVSSGLQAGDIIIKFNDTEITSMTDLLNAKKKYHAGDTVKLLVNRSGEEIPIEFTFGTQPQTAAPQPESIPSNVPSSEEDLYDYFFGGNPFNH